MLNAERSTSRAVEERLKLFISYSRSDSEIADALVASLLARGFDVTIDTRSLPFGEKWQAELAEFIRTSDTVIWLISDHSIQSHWVNWELDEVARRNKRLVPVLVGDTPRDKLPRQLGDIHILPAAGLYKPDEHFETLVQVLKTNNPWLKEASRLSDRATEWLGSSRSGALLLQGSALSAAERWKERRPHQAPAPPTEVLDLILESRKSATRRQRYWVGGSVAVAAVSLALAAVAYTLKLEADQQRSNAKLNESKAVQNEKMARKERDAALATQSRFLNDLARQELRNGNASNAVLLAVEALPADKTAPDARPYLAEAEATLYAGVSALRERKVLSGHTFEIRHHAISKDGKYGATASGSSEFSRSTADNSARVWDLATGKEIRSFNGHKRSINYVAFSPNGDRLVTASDDNTAIVWNVESGAKIARLEGHKYHVMRAEFIASGHEIITSSGGDEANRGGVSDGMVRVWDATTGWEKFSFSGELFAISRDDRVLATASDTEIAIWSFEEKKKLVSINAKNAKPRHLEFSPDGKQLIAALADGSAQVWNVSSGQERNRLLGHALGVLRAHFSPDGSQIVTFSGGVGSDPNLDADRNVPRIWDASTGKQLVLLQGHAEAVTSVSFSPDGQHVVSSSNDGSLFVWDARSGRDIAKLGGHTSRVNHASFTPDGRLILSSGGDNIARLWSVNSATHIATVRKHRDKLYHTRFSPDGTTVLTGGGFGAYPWYHENYAPAERIARLSSFANWDSPIDLTGHEKVIRHAGFSPDGKSVVTTSDDHTARIWDTASGETTAVIRGHRGTVVHADFSPDNRLLVTASKDRTARVWRTNTGAEVASLAVGERVNRVRFSPKGHYIATATESGKVLVWNAQTFNKALVLEGHTYGVFHVEFSLDEEYLVTVAGGIRPTGFPAQSDRSARLWSVKDGRPLAKLEHADSVITYAFFSSDSQLVITCGNGSAAAWATRTGKSLQTFDLQQGWIFECALAPQGDKLLVTSSSGHASLWDVASGKLLQMTPVHPSGVNAASLDKTGEHVAVGYEDGNAIVWKTFRSTKELMEFAESAVPRSLTSEQRRQFFLD